MAAIPTYFTDFVAEIRLTRPLEKDCREKHLELRRHLKADPDLSKVIIDAFLQLRPVRPPAG